MEAIKSTWVSPDHVLGIPGHFHNPTVQILKVPQKPQCFADLHAIHGQIRKDSEGAPTLEQTALVKSTQQAGGKKHSAITKQSVGTHVQLLQQLKQHEEVMQVVNQPKTKVLGKAKHFGVVPLGPALVAPAGALPPSPLEMNTGGKPSTVGGRGPITRTHHLHTQQLAHRQQGGLHNRADSLSQTGALALSKPACWNLGQQTSSEFRVSDQLLFAPRPKINLDNEQQLNSQNPLMFTHEPPKHMAQKDKRRGSLVGVLPMKTRNGGKTYKNTAELPGHFVQEVAEQEDGDLWLLRGCVTVLQLLDAVGQRSAVNSNFGGEKLLELALELPKMREALQKKAQVMVEREQLRQEIGEDGAKGSEQSTDAATEARLETRAAMLQAMSENQRAEAMMLEIQQAEVMLENQRQRELLAAQLETVSESQRQGATRERQQREALADQLSKDDDKQDGIDQLMQKNAEDEFEREQLLHMQQMKEAQLQELILLGAESEGLLEATILELAAQDEQGNHSCMMKPPDDHVCLYAGLLTGEPKVARSWMSEEEANDILPQADWFDNHQLDELLNEVPTECWLLVVACRLCRCLPLG